MRDATVHRFFRELRTESGLSQGSEMCQAATLSSAA